MARLMVSYNFIFSRGPKLRPLTSDDPKTPLAPVLIGFASSAQDLMGTELGGTGSNKAEGL